MVRSDSLVGGHGPHGHPRGKSDSHNLLLSKGLLQHLLFSPYTLLSFLPSRSGRVSDASQSIQSLSTPCPKMPSLLVIIFVLQLTIHLVNTFGVETINNTVLFPTSYPLCSLLILFLLTSCHRALSPAEVPS